MFQFIFGLLNQLLLAMATKIWFSTLVPHKIDSFSILSISKLSVLKKMPLSNIVMVYFKIVLCYNSITMIASLLCVYVTQFLYCISFWGLGCLFS